MVKVFIEKKSTAPNSANVSIATRDNPATIAGLAAGNIKEYKDLNESDVVNYVKKSINTMADGSIKESNVKNIEDTAKSLEEESSSNSSLPWAEPEPEESGEE